MQNEPSKTGAVIVTPEEAEAIRPFGLDMDILELLLDLLGLPLQAIHVPHV